MPTARHYVHFLGLGSLAVVTLSPASGATITTVTPTLTWAFSSGSGVQSAYRVAIYSDAAGTVNVYDSGWVANAVLSHTMIGGLLSSDTTYYWRVAVVDTSGNQGESALSSFFTAFATALNIAGLRVAGMGGCETEQSFLPHAVVSWTQIVPPGAETFVKYQIRRRSNGGAWEVLGEVTTITTTTFTDWTPAGWTPYQYAVVYYATSGVSTLISAVMPKTVVLQYDFAWLHAVDDPQYAVRLESFEFAIDVADSVALDLLWARALPVSRIGAQNYRRISVTLSERPLRDPRWAALRALQQHQIDTGTILCFRHGRSRETMFCAMQSLKASNHQRTQNPAVQLIEIDPD